MRQAPLEVGKLKPGRAAFVTCAGLYALLILYVSTVLSPVGFNYTPMPLDQSLTAFVARAGTWLDTGSDQRADWLGNLMMLVPLGFMLMGSMAPRLGQRGAWLRATTALLAGAAFVLAVKWCQLFFPPRTVTLNYVTAQTAGLIIGIALHRPWTIAQARIARHQTDSTTALSLLLRAYTIALIVFLLMPLDVALNLDDIADQIARFPDAFTMIPGADRSRLVQAMVLISGSIALAPVGMLLALSRLGQGMRATIMGATLRGFLLMTGVFLASAMVMGAHPSALTVVLRTIGIALGAWGLVWLRSRDPTWLRQVLHRLVPWSVLPYLVLLLAVNGLLSRQWLPPEEAWQLVPPRSLLPLYNYYIVSKAAAARNVLAHVAMYAPVGLIIWARYGRPGTAAILAAIVGALVEGGRFLRPELQGEYNTVVIAAFAAWLSAHAAALVWTWLWPTRVTPKQLPAIVPPVVAVIGPAARGMGPVPGWRERAAAARRQNDAPADRIAPGNGPPGPVEHY